MQAGPRGAGVALVHGVERRRRPIRRPPELAAECELEPGLHRLGHRPRLRLQRGLTALPADGGCLHRHVDDPSQRRDLVCDRPPLRPEREYESRRLAVDGVAQTQVSRAATATTANGFGMGATANASVYTANYDDIVVTNQSSAYPVGDGRVVRLLPDSMGTSSGATNFRNNDGTAIDATSWQRLDEPTMTSTADYVRQQANSATSVLEFGFQDTAEICIRDVSAVLSYHAAGNSADNGKTSVFDGAAESVLFSGDMSQAALQYKSAVVTPAASPWTQAAVDGLVARVGYSTDSNPNPYWDAIVLEAAVSDVPAYNGSRTAAQQAPVTRPVEARLRPGFRHRLSTPGASPGPHLPTSSTSPVTRTF